MSYLNNASSLNFKEFSSQLVSRFSMIQDRAVTNNSAKPNVSSTTQAGDEFIDNEIYKFVLNGKRNVTVPPGFDPKEAREIEELGEKIATFQIETDTEISLFNTDTNSSDTSSSSHSEHSDHEPDDDFVWDENKDNDGIKNLAKLNEIKKNRLSKKKSQAKQQEAPADSKSSKSNSIKSSRLLDLKNAKQLVDVLESQALLPTVKVFCDWLLCNKKIIQSISQVLYIYFLFEYTIKPRIISRGLK